MLDSFLTIDLLKKLLGKLLEPSKERSIELGKISSDFGDPIVLSKFYIEPNCQHLNPADEEDFIPQISAPIFSYLTEYLKKQHVLRDGRGHLFVLGDAGTGKTSLLVMLKLLRLTSFWPTECDVRLYKLGAETLNQVAEVADPSRTILLLDAVDEDPMAWGNYESRLSQLIQHTLNFRGVVFSCRTQFFPHGNRDPFQRSGHLTLRGFTCPAIYISPFTPKQIQLYLDRLELDDGSRLRATALIESMGPLTCRPLLLAYIEDLLSGEIAERDVYGIYEALTDAWLNREITKHSSLTKADLLSACLFSALYMQKDLSRTISLRDLGKATVLSRSEPVMNLDKFDIGGRSLLNKNSEGDFRFAHFTIQEFLLAKGMLEQRFEFADVSHLKITRMTISFLRSFAERRNKRYDAKHDSSNVIWDAAVPGSNLCHINGENLHSVNTNLIGIRMENVDIFNFSIDNCCLNYSESNGARLYSGSILNTFLRHAEFCDGSFVRTRFHKCRMDNSIFSGIRLEDCSFDGSTLSNAQFLDSHLIRCSFHDADIIHIKLDRVDIDGSDFSGARNIDIHEIIKSTNWQKAKFSEKVRKHLDSIIERRG